MTPTLDAGRNFGALVQARRGNDLLANAADHAPRMQVPRHAHENAYLCIVVAGGFELRHDGARPDDCGPGAVVAHPAGAAHANRFGDAPARCVNLHFGASWTEDPSVRAWFADFRHARLGAHAGAVARLAEELLACDAAAPLAFTAAAVELLAQAMRAGAPAPSAAAVARAIDLLEADLARAPGLATLAAAVGLHPSHLARAFRAARGETVGDYVRRRRVESSVALLARPELSLAEVAAAAGFADQAHFGRVFKRHLGATPGARRRELLRTS